MVRNNGKITLIPSDSVEDTRRGTWSKRPHGSEVPDLKFNDVEGLYSAALNAFQDTYSVRLNESELKVDSNSPNVE